MEYDVVVVGAGNAAMCSALAAEEAGAKVLVLEAATEELGGGNTRFTAGAIRTVYNGVDDLRDLMPDLTDAECEITDFGTYTEDQFFDDMFRVTEYRTDPELVEILVKNSLDTLKWMRGKGIRFAPIWGRQAFKVDGRFKFWGGLTVEAWGEDLVCVRLSGSQRKKEASKSFSKLVLPIYCVMAIEFKVLKLNTKAR